MHPFYERIKLHVSPSISLFKKFKIKNEKFCNILKEKKNPKECEGVCKPPLKTPPELWLCLECCFAACGRYENKCSLEHYTSSTHSLAINLNSLKIW